MAYGRMGSFSSWAPASILSPQHREAQGRCQVVWEDMSGLWPPLLDGAITGLWASLSLSLLNCELNSQLPLGGLLGSELARGVRAL